MRIIILLLFFFAKNNGFAQKYNSYKTHPSYMDSVIVYINTEGYMRDGRGNNPDSNATKVNDKTTKEIMAKCEDKLTPVLIHLDSIELKTYLSSLHGMIKSYSCDNCLIRNKDFLRLFQLSDSACAFLKKGNTRFFIGVYYVYYHNNKLLQGQQRLNTSSINYSEYNSIREVYICVIDLETKFPVYFEQSQSKHHSSSIPRDIDIKLDFYTFNKFFKGVKKRKH